ncbi:MAG: hypothetical protein EDR02_05050 [Actinobacteria bacterium]|nr:MAG: hypothetical protein EDR02_05050 [Actinomycetota bacterium]
MKQSEVVLSDLRIRHPSGRLGNGTMCLAGLTQASASNCSIGCLSWVARDCSRLASRRAHRSAEAYADCPRVIECWRGEQMADTSGGPLRRGLLGAAGGVLSIALITITGLAIAGPSAEEDLPDAGSDRAVLELQVAAALCPVASDTATVLLDPGVDARSWASEMETELRQLGLTDVTPLSAEEAHARLDELVGEAEQFSQVREPDLRGVVLLRPSALAGSARTLPQVSEVVDVDGALLPTYTDMLNGRWQGGVNMIVFFQPEARSQDIDAVTNSIASDPTIATYYYVDQQETYAEFRDLFSDQPDKVAQVTPEELPTSLRLVVSDPMSLAERSRTYRSMVGVREVLTAPSFPGIEVSFDSPAARDALEQVNSNCGN